MGTKLGMDAHIRVSTLTEDDRTKAGIVGNRKVFYRMVHSDFSLVPREKTPPYCRPKPLDQLRMALRSLHCSRRTEQSYIRWVKRLIFFHGVRHPSEMAEPEINSFLIHSALTHSAATENLNASTQNQAPANLLFPYRNLLDRKIGDLGEVVRACKPKRLPVVMTQEEVKAVLANLSAHDSALSVFEHPDQPCPED